jgi:hypothetical protein
MTGVLLEIKIMRSIIVFLILSLLACPVLADETSPKKESSITDEKDLGKFNEGPATVRDRPAENISHPCPYTCNDAGYSHGQCREWQDGNTCMIGPKLDAPQSEN